MSVYQIVYCSRNKIDGTAQDVDGEIGAILSSAREKNRDAGISGALMFNGTAFAQVLEGPLDAVEHIFEIIQCDTRHSDVVVLRNGPAEARVFSDWSMAYADPAAVHLLPDDEPGLDQVFASPESAAPLVVNLLRQLVVRAAA